MNSKTWSTLITLVGASVGPLVAQELAPAMRLQAETTYLRRAVDFESGTAMEAFRSALRSAGKPGGVVMSSGCGEPVGSPLHLSADSSLAAALDIIAAIFPTHHWTVSDGGTFNQLPNQDMTPVMAFPIPQFEWDTSAIMYANVQGLFEVPGIRDRLAKLGMVGAVEYLRWQDNRSIVRARSSEA